MKFIYTVRMDRRHMPGSELLTSLLKDTIRSFNALMLANAQLEHIRFVTDAFGERRVDRLASPARSHRAS
jgi:hypothetical protein